MDENRVDLFEKLIGAETFSWQEYSMGIASEALTPFSKYDWDVLFAITLAKPLYWQERCAEAIGCLEHREGLAILMALLLSPSKDIAVTAVIQLDYMSAQLPRRFEVALRNLLAYVNENEIPLDDVVRGLIERLN
ncbi:hypothetical protein [Undibacterium umbellatum]|jgi:hypothetical protein|uniref:Uncharacterized protein n=1 Tax=Undibacterium umbellatum TaxID=2762300 RepID=A0ABR6ZGM9_9BURK|nr:hypothetical protein [Undibacterium umbellatum]MBC3910824.1 hypothetical protein [Undibacterium umbellatum]